MPKADLHVHSLYSDGSTTPEEIVEAALANGVDTLAVADHNVVEGSLLTMELCRKTGIRCLPAVEIDALDGETNFHILAYNFDVHHAPFLAFLSHTRFLLDESSVKLAERMQADYPQISLAEFMDYTHDRRQGGWSMLHYLMEKGLTSSLKEGIRFYPRYGMTFSQSGYSTVAAVALRIKAAGGHPVLAHPGNLIDTTDIERFKTELRRMVSLGLEGIECYYPYHASEVTQACLDVCEEYDLLITCGSDCHGTFADTKVGELDIPVDKLRLKNMLK